MEKFARGFFSMRMMALAMIVFFVAIATATMVESTYDTQTAKIFIYNAIWFDLLLVYLCFSLIANVYRYQMFRKEKLAALSFHLSFIIILIGAAVTRFVSFEGQMIIGEGESVNFIYSSDPYFYYKVDDKNMQNVNSQKLLLSEMDTWNNFSFDASIPKHKDPISIDYVDFKKNMVDSLVMDSKFEETTIEFMREGRAEYVTEGEFLMWGELAVSYEKNNAMPGIEIFREQGKLRMKVMVPGGTSLPMSVLRMSDRENPNIADSLYNQLPLDTLIALEKATLYAVGGVQFVYRELKKNTRVMKMPSEVIDEGVDILTVKIVDGSESKLVELEGGYNTRPAPVMFNMNGLTYELKYGVKKIELPFLVRCDDFRLKKYPGSQAPSSYESDVTVLSNQGKELKSQEIFMNTVMDYGGYRFFQSSYFPDESGTILSVNHDWWGTNITYLGYLFMALGMILTLIAKNGRFRELNRKLKKSAARRVELIGALALILAFSPASFSQEHNEHDGHNHEVVATPNNENTEAPRRPDVKAELVVMSKQHSDSVATLLIQDFKGRIIPMHTHCDEYLRKMSRSNTFGELNAIQTIMSMHMYPDYWVDQRILYASSKGGLRESLKLPEGESNATFRELTDESTGGFLLYTDYQKAHQKMEGRRNEYDKQVLKLGEHFQVFSRIMNWEDMKLLPVKGAENDEWFVPLNSDLMKLDSLWSHKTLKYFSSLNDASKSGNYEEANTLLLAFKNHQYEEGSDVAPSRSAVSIEVSYNKMNIFKNSGNMYGLLGGVLLLIFFIQVFAKPTSLFGKILKRTRQLMTAVLIVTFVYHGAGLIMRSYITGFAPWSDGYEAMVFIGWVTILIGLIFTRKNAAIIAGAAIMAFMIITVANMNLLDPEITPMQPVLKSYWLMIHVAIITGSYAPLGLSCILGFITLILYIVRNKNSSKLLDLQINELTFISEMIMLIGLFMLTIGTFLGGIWANESWGRYWGWDSKETWALAAVLVYAIILHFRFIPALKSKFTFNVFGFWGYASVLFTFFGVNFYLTGLHSYAQGDGGGAIPEWLKWVVLALYIFTEWAWVRNKLFVLKGQMISFKTLRNKLLLFLGGTVFMSYWIYLFGLASPLTVVEEGTKVFVIMAAVNIFFFLYAILVSKKSKHAKLNF